MLVQQSMALAILGKRRVELDLLAQSLSVYHRGNSKADIGRGAQRLCQWLGTW